MKTHRKYSFCVAKRRAGTLSTSARVVLLKKDPNQFHPGNKIIDETVCRVRCYPRDVRVAKKIARRIAILLNTKRLDPSQLKKMDIRTPEELLRVYNLYLVKEEEQHEDVEKDDAGT
jgi:hypothetical protein